MFVVLSFLKSTVNRSTGNMMCCRLTSNALMLYHAKQCDCVQLTERRSWWTVGDLSLEISGSVCHLQRQWSQLQALWTGCLPQLQTLGLGGQVQGLTCFLNTQQEQMSRGGATSTYSGETAKAKGVRVFQLCTAHLACRSRSVTPL